MKKLAIATVICLFALPAFAQTRFQQVITFHVKPGHELEFVQYVERIRESFDELEIPVTWSMFRVGPGNTGPTYRAAVPFDDWSERDRWGNESRVQQFKKVFGEENGERFFREGEAAIERSETRVWELLEDASSNLDRTQTAPATMYYVALRRVRNEMNGDYLALEHQRKAAHDAVHDRPIMRWRLVLGEGANRTYRFVVPYESWADYGNNGIGSIVAKLTEEVGAEQWSAMQRVAARAVENVDSFLSIHVPGLSRPAARSTSNE